MAQDSKKLHMSLINKEQDDFKIHKDLELSLGSYSFHNFFFLMLQENFIKKELCTSFSSNGPFYETENMSKLFNEKFPSELIKFIDQGGIRSGAIPFYIEPKHDDILDFLTLKKV